MELSEIFVLVGRVGVVFVIAVIAYRFAVIVYRFWRALTTPNVAYKLGLKAGQLGRKTGDAALGAAHIAGQVTGKVGNVAEDVGRSFQEGRDATKRGSNSPDDGA